MSFRIKIDKKYVEEQEEKLRQITHDLRNHLTCVYCIQEIDFEDEELALRMVGEFREPVPFEVVEVPPCNHENNG